MATGHWLTRGSLVTLILIVIGCSAIGHQLWNQRYGAPTPREPLRNASEDDRFQAHIKPLIEHRCTVCHGCYDAPCQLKMEAREGLFRGAHEDKVYDGTRLLGAELTRLFEDADSTAQWREKGFFPVINERADSAQANLQGSVLARMLQLKRQHPLPTQPVLPDSFDFSLNRDWHCPKAETFDNYAEDYPLWGMPYGLPGLSEREHNRLIHWLEDGAPAGAPNPIGPELQQTVQQWEQFFNADSLKARLTNRYLYEHLFLANLHFEPNPKVFFKLVRSSTPPGEPIERISTRRPFDDPGVDRVYYRLWRDPSSIVAKNHLPYALTPERMVLWREWFLNADYAVTELPGYQPEQAANPFATFVDLPVKARYQFLLDEAEFTIMNFIKGPVCRGQVALNVIQDHFWVSFVDPAFTADKWDGEFLANNSEHLKLPAGVGNTLLPMTNWRRYSQLQKNYLAAKATHLSNKFGEREPLTMEMIWDGEGRNTNAALTIFRHTDSASVHRGFIGPEPKTSWVIDYPLLERIHYLLVAGFDVYGNTSHQLLSRLYMDFLRMEGEMNFINFLPEPVQEPTIAHWYRDAEEDLKEYLDVYQNNLQVETALEYPSGQDHQRRLYQLLSRRLQPVLSGEHQLDELALNERTREALQTLHSLEGEALRVLPPTTVIYVPDSALFTLIHHNAYSNLSSLFMEQERRLPQEDTLSVAAGIIGSYPNSFMMMDERDIPAFVNQVRAMSEERDYRKLKDRYGVRRSDPNFWEISDDIHALYRERAGVRAGLLDYNRLENR
ncbi:fatty acid cis/trans isomerase [Marinimicrobium koreense]|uniref:fatty acid cis/trans isomerase n=1 Tax=Marinimicrobium koreense TaxID=306545 RepID=UPI003F6E5EFB